MIWTYFILFALTAVVLWAAGAFTAWKERRRVAIIFTVSGLIVFFSYIVMMWITLERPPLRTMGETRLWYSLFLPFAGVIVYGRWRYKWILAFSTTLSSVFVCFNIFKPEIHSKTLMPALQSPWFAPHVIVYMMAYAILGAALVMAMYLLLFRKTDPTPKECQITDDLVYVGVSLSNPRYAHGCSLGQGSMGTLLELGPERNLGSYNLAILSCLYSLSPLSSYCLSYCSLGITHWFLSSTNVLVGHKLSAFGERSQCSHL